MRRLLCTLILVLASVPALAQTPTSTTQMQLTTSQTFLNRLIYNGVQVMAEVLVEPASAGAASPIPAYTTACHTRRAQYAQNFLLSAASYAAQASVLISGTNVSGVVIVGSLVDRAAVPGTDPPLWDSSVADSALMQAFRVHMNSFAGCVTNAGS